MIPTALTIAGSDPSGGAGIQADLKTFHQRGVYGMAVITLLTVQNTQGVQKVEVVKSALVVRQLKAILADIPPRAAKTGALGNTAVIHAVANADALVFTQSLYVRKLSLVLRLAFNNRNPNRQACNVLSAGFMRISGKNVHVQLL